MPTGQPTIEEVLLKQNEALAINKRIIEDGQAQFRDAIGYIDLLISRNRRPWLQRIDTPEGGRAEELHETLEEAISSQMQSVFSHCAQIGHKSNILGVAPKIRCSCDRNWTVRFATTEDHERMEAAAEEHVAGERP